LSESELENPAAVPHPSGHASERTVGGKLVLLLGTFLMLVIVCGGLFLVFRVDLDERVREMVIYLGHDDPKFRKLAAFQLWKVGEGTTHEVRRNAGIDESMVGQKLLTAFRSKRTRETDTRRFLSLALGHFNCQQAVPYLIKEIQPPNQPSPDLRLDVLFSLGMLQNPDAISALVEETRNEQADVRQAAADGLGRMGDRSVINDLKKLLDDPNFEVEWSAALALANLGSSAGGQSLGKILNTEFIDSLEAMNEQRRERIMVPSIRAISRLRIAGFEEELKKIGSSDRNLRVRSAALRTIKDMKGE